MESKTNFLEYKFNMRDVMHDLTMAGARPTWTDEYRDSEQSRVMSPFRDRKPQDITKDDVINFLEFEEKKTREYAYDFAHGIINGKIGGTGKPLDESGKRSYEKALPAYYKLWLDKKHVLECAKSNIEPELVADFLLNHAAGRFDTANHVRTDSVIEGYKDRPDRLDKHGNWLSDMWIFGVLGERAQKQMAWNFVAAAELYTNIMKIEKGLDFPLEADRHIYYPKKS